MADSIPYDEFYKRFFSRKVMMQSLLEDFAPPDIVQELDLAVMDLYGTELVSENCEVRRADLIWRTRAGGGPCYVYVMTEFQSRLDRRMPLRMLEYTLLLWRTLEVSGALTPDGPYPHVLPIVLYNGDAPWETPKGLTDIIGPGGRWPCDPVYDYILMDEKHMPQEALERAKGPARALILGEQARTGLDFMRAGLAVNCELAVEPGLRDDMLNYLALRMRKTMPQEYAAMMDDNKRRRSAMLEGIYSSFTRQVKAEAREEGLAEGRTEGRTEGMAEALLTVLRVRFGSVKSEWQDMINLLGRDAALDGLLQIAVQCRGAAQFTAALEQAMAEAQSGRA